jgi:hypothetical protein
MGSYTLGRTPLLRHLVKTYTRTVKNLQRAVGWAATLLTASTVRRGSQT